jgi:predicted DNA-binding transcriptional regulator AlpA
MKAIEGTGLRPIAPDTALPSPTSAGRSTSIAPVLLTEDEAAAAYGVSRRTFQSLCGEPYMPRAIVLGPRLHRYSLDELRAAVASMPRQTERTQPEGLLRTRIERAKRNGDLR